MGIETGKPVTHDDPIDGTAVALGPDLFLLPHHFGVMAGSHDGHAGAVHMGQHVEIEEAIVDRRNQRIGVGMGQRRQRPGAARGVDDHDIVIDDAAFQQQPQPFGLGPVGFVGFVLARPLRRLDGEVLGRFDVAAGSLDKGATVGQVPGQRPLAKIDVDAGH